MDCTTVQAADGTVEPGQTIQSDDGTQDKEPAELCDSDVNTRDERPLDDKEDDSFRSESKAEPCWSDSEEDDPGWSDQDEPDVHPDLKRYHEDEVERRRSNGQEFDGGYLYRPTCGRLIKPATRATGVVFLDDDFDIVHH